MNIRSQAVRACVCAITGSVYISIFVHIYLASLPNVFCIYWNCRSSLSGSGISSSTKLPPSNTQPPGTYKFSTFGYNPLDDDIGVQEIPMQSTYDRRIASITPNRFDAPSPGFVYTYEHPTKYETPSPVVPSSATTNLRTFTGGGGGGTRKSNVKTEHSQLTLEIRNSAPDVIIMTSHWFWCEINKIQQQQQQLDKNTEQQNQTKYILLTDIVTMNFIVTFYY